jgi:hypothetical protein
MAAAAAAERQQQGVRSIHLWRVMMIPNAGDSNERHTGYV